VGSGGVARRHAPSHTHRPRGRVRRAGITSAAPGRIPIKYPGTPQGRAPARARPPRRGAREGPSKR
jgi:hypothetical protein